MSLTSTGQAEGKSVSCEKLTRYMEMLVEDKC